jgi:hypothetical protein
MIRCILNVHLRSIIMSTITQSHERYLRSEWRDCLRLSRRCQMFKLYQKMILNRFLNTIRTQLRRYSTLNIVSTVLYLHKLLTSRWAAQHDYSYTLFLYIYALTFIHIHLTFIHIHSSSIKTSLLIKITRRHARCICIKLAVLQHKSFTELFIWSSAFDTCKHDLNRAIFNVDYQVWNEKLVQEFRFWCSSTNKH